MAKTGEKTFLNAVEKNAILCETIAKETRHQRLFTHYGVNPYIKMHTITGKPNSLHDSEEGVEDSHFKDVIKRANLEPVKKYTTPQTEAQEIGWITKPLIDSDPEDRRLNFPRQSSAITRYMAAAWLAKEAENLNASKNNK